MRMFQHERSESYSKPGMRWRLVARNANDLALSSATSALS